MVDRTPYRVAQRRHHDAFVDEVLDRKAKVKALDEEVHEAEVAANAEVGRVVARGVAACRAAEVVAEAKARQTDSVRLRQMQQHHEALRMIEAEIEAERQAADQTLQELEAETQEIYRAGHAEIERINAERDAATTKARERCMEVRLEAEDRCRELEKQEREALAKARNMQQQEEAQRAIRVSEAEERLEGARRQVAEAVETTQQSVAERVRALVGESAAQRTTLAQSRNRADGRLSAEIDRVRGDTDLVNMRLVEILNGQQADPRFVQELAELARKLRHKGFWAASTAPAQLGGLK